MKDTVYRVGCDLLRKLHRTDRIIGAIELCLSYNLPCDAIVNVFTAGLCFIAQDDSYTRLEQDEQFITDVRKLPFPKILQSYCRLDPNNKQDAKLIFLIINQFHHDKLLRTGK